MKKVIIASILIVGLSAGLAYSRGGSGMGGSGMTGGSGMMGGSGTTDGSGTMNGSGMIGGYRGDHDDSPGYGYREPDGWDNETRQKFLEDTVGLRKELNDKQFEYSEARRNPDTNGEQLASIEKEIVDIRTKLQEKAQQEYKN